jgi:plasmid stability protein
VKTTIELPDDLLTEVKVEAARRHKKLKELVPELVRAGLRAKRTPAPARSRESEKWLEAWVRLGEEATREAASGPTATEILAADRRRLERR